MQVASAAVPVRHLRARRATATRVTSVELFFDLVYVFAVTQLAHLLLDDLSVGGAVQAAFLLTVVWWAWINTAWMTNWFDPDSPLVRAVLSGVMLASLLLAAALPLAFGADGVLFASAYVGLQVGRNAAAAVVVRDHRLGDVFGRLLAWSIVSAPLWLAGTALEGEQRLLLWGPALALDLLAPVVGYWLPSRGSARTSDYDIDPGHFAERCHLFVIIALGESIVVSGVTASEVGLTSPVVLGLTIAFLETVALWWLYFGPPADRSGAVVDATEDPGRLARDAYTYVHMLIVAGIVAIAAGHNLLIAHPHIPQHGVGLATVLGGPALFLFGTSLFQRMTTWAANPKRPLTAVLILGLFPIAPHVSTLALATGVTALLSALSIWELRATSSQAPIV